MLYVNVETYILQLAVVYFILYSKIYLILHKH